MADGLLDTNVFIHALANDALSSECRLFLDLIEQGRLTAYLDPLVVHELTYVLPRYLCQLCRTDITAYLLDVLRWPGIVADKPTLREALDRWDHSLSLSFVDAYLAVRAIDAGAQVYTKNIREVAAQGATVPNPLPGGGQIRDAQ